jgi:nanoRNase/pAp phosphatase (c-di-AMP/oligoRNAs hydrolase)
MFRQARKKWPRRKRRRRKRRKQEEEYEGDGGGGHPMNSTFKAILEQANALLVDASMLCISP